MTTETSNARGEVVAWEAEFPDGWKEFAADGEPEVTEWPTWRQPPASIRPLTYADAAPPPAAARGDVRGLVADRAAIKLLVAAGFVTEDKANEALRIAHGFDKGPLAPQPMQQGGGEVVAEVLRVDEGTALVALFDDSLRVGSSLYTEPPSTPVGVERKYPDDGNGDDDAYNRGWNECLDALATQHQEPTT